MRSSLSVVALLTAVLASIATSGGDVGENYTNIASENSHAPGSVDCGDWEVGVLASQMGGLRSAEVDIQLTSLGASGQRLDISATGYPEWDDATLVGNDSATLRLRNVLEDCTVRGSYCISEIQVCVDGDMGNTSSVDLLQEFMFSASVEGEDPDLLLNTP